MRLDYGFGGGGTVDAPAAGDAFEFPLSAVFEEEPGAGDQILDRLRDEHLACAGGGGDPGADRDGQAGDFPVVKLALAGVDACADLEAEFAHGFGDRLGASDRAGGAVEGREEAVAGGVALLAAEADQLSADKSVVTLEQIAPSTISELCRALGRADDVGEENGRQNAARGPREPPPAR